MALNVPLPLTTRVPVSLVNEPGQLQVALAQQLACPQSVISKVERGDQRLDFVEFVGWADALGLDLPLFLERYRTRLASLAAISRLSPP